MYRDKKVIHIVCTGKNGEIGYDNKLLFNLPPDMKFFREQTLGHTNWMDHANPLGETLTYRFTKWVRKQAIPF